MPYSIRIVDVWVGSIKDKPGALAEALKPLAAAGVNLEFVLARRDQAGKGLVFVAPIEGEAQTRAAAALKLGKSDTLQVLRISGMDRVGLGVDIMGTLAEAGINVRGLSAMAFGKRSVFYIALDSKQDSAHARRVLATKLGVL
ncbi:MAG TPA: ACT domain-containing protein [Candidatus Hydrogenedentes bacterium]|nr:ACT domain-containing protein [Candidatus Hydrogenedentota bacterium]HPG67486.1 ACT domain-containing protein [Candidatus Hydrogenedentota bacterium]